MSQESLIPSVQPDIHTVPKIPLMTSDEQKRIEAALAMSEGNGLLLNVAYRHEPLKTVRLCTVQEIHDVLTKFRDRQRLLVERLREKIVQLFGAN